MNTYTTTAKKQYSEDKSFIILSDRYIPQYKYLGNYGELFLDKENSLSLQIKTILKSDPKADIIVVTGFRANKIINKHKNVRYVENVLYDETGQIESLRLALNVNIRKNIFIMSGNIIPSVRDINELIVESSISIKDENNPKKAYRYMGLIYDNNNISLSMAYRCKNIWNDIVYVKDELTELLYKKVNSSKKTLEFCEVVKNIVNENFKVVKQNNIHRLDGDNL